MNNLLRWWRSWHGAPTDPKWLLVANEAGVSPALVAATFWALCDYASQHEERGSVAGFDVETYAFWAQVRTDQIEAVIAALTRKRVIVGDRLANWDKRQPRREDDSTERVRAHRQRKRAENAQEQPVPSEQVERDGTPGNAAQRAVTPDEKRQDERNEVLGTSGSTRGAPGASARDDSGARRADQLRASPYDLYTALCEELEAPVETPPPPKQLGIAKRLARRYDAEDVRGCLRFLVSQHWRTSPIDLATVDAQIEGWILNGRPESEPPPRARPARDPDAFDYARNLRYLTGQRGSSTERA